MDSGGCSANSYCNLFGEETVTYHYCEEAGGLCKRSCKKYSDCKKKVKKVYETWDKKSSNANRELYLRVMQGGL